ncbi:glycosyltransferase family 2 protein [Shimia sp.]|uniref:glycosyltransferase family 2 protein n=1 Tax=Shimia sp. TaxID=1954381 RepID=UPI003BAC2FF2
MNIDIGICTFRRDSLYDTLESLSRQNLEAHWRLRIIVSDNDEQPVKQSEIEAWAAELGVNLKYVHAPARNISIARNACLENAEADFLLFIDDDETAEPGWVMNLLETATREQAQIVFGPVYAVYPPDAPKWMRDNEIHSSVPSKLNGKVETGFSGNVLLDLREPKLRDARFRLDFGKTGGEDIDFFFRHYRAGLQMAISKDAIVYEPVAPARLSFKWLSLRSIATGTIYGFCARQDTRGKTASLMGKSIAKISYCSVRTLASISNRKKLTFWALRGCFHIGVLRGCFRKPHNEFYG